MDHTNNIRKSVKYAKERNETINELFNILDLDDANSFILYELDRDVEKQKKIMNLLQPFRRYFDVAGSTYQQKGRRPYLSIVKNALKLKYDIFSKETVYSDDGNTHRTTRYFLVTKKEYLTNYMDILIAESGL